MGNTNDEKVRKSLGEKLRKAREKVGLTQAQVANESGLHPNFYARVERGEENLSYENLHSVAKVLKIKII